MDKLDETLQRKLAVNSLMGSAGLTIFKADMSEDMAYVNAEIEKVTKRYIDNKSLSLLNYNLGMKAGLEMVLNRLANFEDELVGDDVKPPKK